MVNTLRVMLWDEEIGRLAWDDRRRLSYFTYNPEFLKKGIEVSPLQAPVHGIRAMTPVWGEDARMYQKLPAFLADSLPDAWGNQLFELWRIQNHIPNADITPLDKLSFIGKRGMGALEFLPEVAKADKAEMIDVKSLADLAERIFIERENAHIMPEESITMQSLLTVSGNFIHRPLLRFLQKPIVMRDLWQFAENYICQRLIVRKYFADLCSMSFPTIRMTIQRISLLLWMRRVFGVCRQPMTSLIL